jgi:hypothetical protein
MLRQSCRQLCQLAQQSGVEVLVETCPARHPDAARRLARLGARAVYVLIDPAEASVEVRPSEQLQKEGFEADRLREQLLLACRKRQYDQGLAEGVRTIRTLVSAKGK